MSDDTYILSAMDIMAMQGEVKTHFLNDKARRLQKSLGKATGLTEIDFSIIEVAPGDESTEHHLHYHEEECWYILEGEATARIGAESKPVKAGDFVGCRKGGLAHIPTEITGFGVRFSMQLIIDQSIAETADTA